MTYSLFRVVKDTILKAIHNSDEDFDNEWVVVKDTILKAIHNCFSLSINRF